MASNNNSPEETGHLHGGMSVMRLLLLPIIALATLAGPGRTQNSAPGTMPALAVVQTGQWLLKSRTKPAESRALCVSDVRALLQVQHGAAICNRFVISNSQHETTVHYTCPGAGHGRTTIKVETPRLIQIESQGIAKQAPFAFELEGRRVGECKVAMLAPIVRPMLTKAR